MCPKEVFSIWHSTDHQLLFLKESPIEMKQNRPSENERIFFEVSTLGKGQGLIYSAGGGLEIKFIEMLILCNTDVDCYQTLSLLYWISTSLSQRNAWNVIEILPPGNFVSITA